MTASATPAIELVRWPGLRLERARIDLVRLGNALMARIAKDRSTTVHLT